MIKGVIRLENNLTVVFDENDQAIPEYQGKYCDVREKILRDAPPEASYVRTCCKLSNNPKGRIPRALPVGE